MEIELNPALVLHEPWKWDEKTIDWAIGKVKAEKYLEGREAFLNGQSENNNPYIKGTYERKYWLDGFLSDDDA